MGSIAILQGTNPFIVTGSVQGSFSVASQVPVFLNNSTNASVITVGGSGPANQSVSGTVGITFPTTGGTSVYAVLSSLTTISIMNANANRKGGTIFNAAGTNVFVKLGTAVT